MVSDDGRALIHEFGFSLLGNSTSVSPFLGGTLRWMAPETLDNSKQSIATDVWAFGMTVLVCLSFSLSCGVKLNLCRNCSRGTNLSLA